MARGRGGRGPSRMDLRRQSEAAESRAQDETEELEEVEEDEEEDEDAETEDEGEVASDTDDDAAEDVDDEEAPKKKTKKKLVKKEAKPKAKRTKAVKIVRQRAVWKVFENNGKIVGTFPYPEKKEAEALMAAKILEKEGKTTFYLQLIKEPIEE